MRRSRLRALFLSLVFVLIACGPSVPVSSPSAPGNAPPLGKTQAKDATASSEIAQKGAVPADPEKAGLPPLAGLAGSGHEGQGNGLERGEGNKAAAGAPEGLMPSGGAADLGVVDPQDPIPVTAADPALGSKTALVTIVEFADFQCHFCKKAAATITELRKLYGVELRVVWKNNPLPFHTEARPAAEAAMALFTTSSGHTSFWTYHDRIFSSAGSALDKTTFESALKASSLTQQDVDRIRQNGAVGKKVDADITLGRRIGVVGTPAFFINGVYLAGAQPIEKFRAIIDAELVKAKQMATAGVALGTLYAKATAKNVAARAQMPSPTGAPPADDKTVYAVPIRKSPAKGSPNALVTIVEFSEFQCPFCMRVESTIEQILTKYGAKVRFIWKNNPLPFHPRAEPAAELALEARAQKGDAGFWKAHGLLFGAKGKLSDEELEAIAYAAGLNTKAVMNAIAKHKYQAEIAADQDLAEDLEAGGTPHFFINGRRLVGAQPLEKFVALIDEELTKAEAMVAKGVPAAQVYEEIRKHAAPPPPPERKTVAAPGKDSPSQGPANAKVVIQVFSDFQCPFCKRVEPTLAAVMAAFPGRVRLVWRNRPLAMHPQAALAAEASLEARAQKGDTGFWKMHDLLLEDQTETGLNRDGLVKHAATMGLDAAKFAAALDAGTHKGAVESDSKIAEGAGISGTPAFVINGYFISGAQPLSRFKKIINRALAEAK